MQQSELFPVPNPCVGVCQSNTKGYCMGCLRSRVERQKWNDLMPAEKMRVIELCDLRKVKLAEAMKLKQERDKLIAAGVDPGELPKPKPKPKPKERPIAQADVYQGGDGMPDNSLDLF